MDDASDALERSRDRILAAWGDPSHEPWYLAASRVLSTIGTRLAAPATIDLTAGHDLGRAVEALAGVVGPLDATLDHIGVLRRVLNAELTAAGATDALVEVQAVVDEVILAAVQVELRRLQGTVMVDPLTGLLNQQALDRDLTIEAGRSRRTARPFSLVDVELKQQRGGEHPGKQEALRMAGGLTNALRSGDVAYRVGGARFVLLLPETPGSRVAWMIRRVQDLLVPAFSHGAASFPEDTTDLNLLVELATVRAIENVGPVTRPV